MCVERSCRATGCTTHIATCIDIVVESVELVASVLWRGIQLHLLLVELGICHGSGGYLDHVGIIDGEVGRDKKLDRKAAHELLLVLASRSLEEQDKALDSPEKRGPLDYGC